MPHRLKIIFALILLLFVLSDLNSRTTSLRKARTDQMEKFKCPPCGCEYENFIFDRPGKCPACNMDLIAANEGFAKSLDQKLAPLFYNSNLKKLYTKILYPIFLLGMIFSLGFLRRSIQKKNLNPFLIGIVLVLSLFGIRGQLYGTGYQLTNSIKGLFTPISFIVLLGPLIFFYVKKITHPSLVWKKRTWLHFVISISIFILYTIGFLLPEKKSVHFMSSPYEVIISHTEQIFSVVLGFVYLFFSYKIFRKWNLSTENQDPKIGFWIKRFLIGMSLFFSSWGVLIFLNYWLYDFGVATVSNYPLWIILGTSLCWLSIEIIAQPQLTLHLTITHNESQPTNYNGDKIMHQKKLEELMLEDRIYLDQDLSLKKLAEYMDIPPRQLSGFINKVLGKTFYELVNFHRVEEVKQMLHDPKNKNLTIEAIAKKAGFKSKSTFNTAFKKQTKMTPRQFLKIASLDKN